MSKALTAGEIIEVCGARSAEFEGVVRNIQYTDKGVMHSEMLLLCAMAEQLGVTQIIESGVAGGQSTHVMAAYFAPKALTIDSVERRKYTDEHLVARRRVRPYPHVRFHYSDAFKAVPRLAQRPCVVLIDGPKDEDALLLAAMMLTRAEVRAVFIHDVSRDSEVRALMERLYPHAFFTDDEAFVQAFSWLDEPCWKCPAFGESGMAPYRHRHQIRQSYAATLGMVTNPPGGMPDSMMIVDTVREELARKRLRREPQRRSLSTSWLQGKALVTRPFRMARFYLQRE